jgi:hypothetical protein
LSLSHWLNEINQGNVIGFPNNLPQQKIFYNYILGNVVYFWQKLSARPSKNNRYLKSKLQLIVKWRKFCHVAAVMVKESAFFS